MKPSLMILIFGLLLSCSNSGNNNEKNKGKTSEIDTFKKNKAESYLGKSNQSEGVSLVDTFTLNGSSWEKIEMTSQTDTALAFYAYRILFTKHKEGLSDCVTRMNLYKRADEVKAIINSIFSGHLKGEKSVNYLIDSLNNEGVKMAKKKVEREKDKYGKSEGPCSEFLKVSQKN